MNFTSEWYYLLLGFAFFTHLFIPNKKAGHIFFSLIFVLGLGWQPLVVLGLFIGLNYFLTQKIMETFSSKIMWASVAMNVGLLVAQKTVLDSNWLLLGLSFLALQALSLQLDTLSRSTKSLSLFDYVHYILFFPKFLLGPMERFNSFQNQNVDSDWHYGFIRICIGLLKKFVMANSLAVMVDGAFADPTAFSGPILLLALVFLRFQIYYDFSGYTDIAIGSARMQGVRLSENFNRPFQADSVGENWRRWHMTMGAFFRDYVFFPLAKKRPDPISLFVFLLLAFLLVGLWHDLKWTFVIWGGLQAVLIGLDWLGARFSPIRFPRFLKVLKTFMVLSIVAAFFKADTVSHVFRYYQQLTEDWSLSQFLYIYQIDRFNRGEALIETSLVILILIGVEFWHCRKSSETATDWLLRQHLTVRCALFSAFLFILYFIGKFGQEEFLYYRF